MVGSLRSVLLLLFSLAALVTSSEGERSLKQGEHKGGSKKKSMRASGRSGAHSKTHSKAHSNAKHVDDDDTQDDDDTASDAKDDESVDAGEEVADAPDAVSDGRVALKVEESSAGTNEVAAEKEADGVEKEDEKEGAEKKAAEKEGAEKEGAEKEGAEKEGAEKEGVESEDKDGDDEEEEESDTSETEAQKAKTEFAAAKLAFLRNNKESQRFRVMLKNIDDKAAQEHEIQDNVDAVASQTQSKALAKFLGDMWKEMRVFAKPFYKEHLEEKLEDLEEASPKLRKRLDEATSEWNKVKDEA